MKCHSVNSINTSARESVNVFTNSPCENLKCYDSTLLTQLLILYEVNMKPQLFIEVGNLFLTPWSESASELYRPSDRRLSAKCLPIFVDRGCHVVSVTDSYS
jgi:hypothetical protein